MVAAPRIATLKVLPADTMRASPAWPLPARTRQCGAVQCSAVQRGLRMPGLRRSAPALAGHGNKLSVRAGRHVRRPVQKATMPSCSAPQPRVAPHHTAAPTTSKPPPDSCSHAEPPRRPAHIQGRRRGLAAQAPRPRSPRPRAPTARATQRRTVRARLVPRLPSPQAHASPQRHARRAHEAKSEPEPELRHARACEGAALRRPGEPVSKDRRSAAPASRPRVPPVDGTLRVKHRRAPPPHAQPAAVPPRKALSAAAADADVSAPMRAALRALDEERGCCMAAMRGPRVRHESTCGCTVRRRRRLALRALEHTHSRSIRGRRRRRLLRPRSAIQAWP